ncbi:MAG: hypothetical protein MUF14_04190 [Hyphomonadaceae bacterium]|jgi:hypothetical protein|nr:hypothetical protein [Hyphomonadaceae bacterium]
MIDADVATLSETLADFDRDALTAAKIVHGTGLSTDYLNVFNEAVMLFGMLADMPDMIDDLRTWQPLSYEEHFKRSGFQAKELAIAAYRAADPSIRQPFDALSTDIGATITRAVQDADALIAEGGDIGEFVTETGFGLQTLIMMLDGMVHGGSVGGAQDDIDALFD